MMSVSRCCRNSSTSSRDCLQPSHIEKMKAMMAMAVVAKSTCRFISWPIGGSGIALHHNLAFFGDGLLEILLGHVIPQQHIIVRFARRNHREAIGMLVDAAIEDDWLFHSDHLFDGVVELGGLFRPDSHALIGLG